MRFKYCFLLLAIAGLFQSCRLDRLEAPSTGFNDPSRVAFSVSMAADRGAATKAGPDSTVWELPDGETVAVSLLDVEMADPFLVRETKGTATSSMYDRFDFVLSGSSLNGVAVKGSDGIYVSTPAMRYLDLPSGSQFVCWAPEEAGVSRTASGRLIYTVPSDVRDEWDVVVAVSDPIHPKTESATPLEFRHVLSGLRVKIAGMFPTTCGLEALTLKGVYLSGEYDPSTGEWAPVRSSVGDIDLFPEYDGTPEGVRDITSTSQYIAKDSHTALFVPQTFPSGARLEIRVNYGGPSFTFSFDLAGRVAEAGHIATLGADGRNFYLFEGTGEPETTFYVRIWDQNVPVEVDRYGKFSVYLPSVGPFTAFSNPNNPDGNRCDNLYTVTHMPTFYNVPWLTSMSFKDCVGLTSVCDVEAPYLESFSFEGCASLVKAPNITTGHVTSTAYAFKNCSKLKYVPDYDFPELVDASYMFQNCFAMVDSPALTNTPKLEVTNYMFQGCSALKNVYPYDFTTIADAIGMFANCSALESLPDFDYSHVVNLSCFAMYSGLRSFAAEGMTNVQWIGSMFNNCHNLTSVSLKGLQSEMQRMDYFCYGDEKLVSVEIEGLRGPFDAPYAFAGCSKLVSGDNWATWDLSGMTDSKKMFHACEALRTVPVWDLSSTLSCEEMFSWSGITDFVVSGEPSSCTSFRSMFEYCQSLGHVSLFDTSSGEDFHGMFAQCTALQNAPLYDTSNGRDFSSMYYYCQNVDQFPLIDTGKGENFGGMYSYAGWNRDFPLINTENGTNFRDMYRGTSARVSYPPIDTKNGIQFDAMFCHSSADYYPMLDTSKGEVFTWMFFNVNLREADTFPLYDLSNGKEFNSMFYAVGNFKVPQAYDFGSATRMTGVFSSCGFTSLPYLNTVSMDGYWAGAGSSYGGGMFDMDSIVSVEGFDAGKLSWVNNYGDTSSFPLGNCKNLTTIGRIDGLHFNLDASGCPKLTDASIANIIRTAKDLTGEEAKTIYVHRDVDNRLSSATRTLASQKNWNLTVKKF